MSLCRRSECSVIETPTSDGLASRLPKIALGLRWKQTRLLSALESVGIYRDTKTPDYLIEEIGEMVEILEREILK